MIWSNVNKTERKNDKLLLVVIRVIAPNRMQDQAKNKDSFLRFLSILLQTYKPNFKNAEMAATYLKSTGMRTTTKKQNKKQQKNKEKWY